MLDIYSYGKEKNGLKHLCEDIRSEILRVVSKNGGHLSSALGAVELIVAMHAVFDCRENPFIFDVSHQAYAHKLLTSRNKSFDTLRKFGGMSGFTHPKESQLDYFIAGHSSTSLSLGVGLARASYLKDKKILPIVLIGDGSMSAGLAYEALNELGERKYPMIVILNDNEMSISRPIGAISRYLSGIMSGSFYQGLKDNIKRLLQKMPESAHYLARRFEEGLKLITPGILFEELGLHYIGPIDGHDIESIVHTLQKAKELKTPVLVHAQTIKGKGYVLAEGHIESWHGVGPFDLKTGRSLKENRTLTPTQVYSNTLLKLAKRDSKIVGITAAMPSGVGLDLLMEYDPDRFWDVGIAEQHAITSSAALAKEGFKPYVSIYSTFLQRGYDQVIHDVGILGLPVKFAIDRAGIVGEDGETHQGLFDIAFLRVVPNFVLFAPRDNASLVQAIEFSLKLDSNPCAFRYPRGGFVLDNLGDADFPIYKSKEFVLGECEVLVDGDCGVLLLGYGNGVGRAEKVRRELLDLGIRATLLDLRFLKPLGDNLEEILLAHNSVYVFSDSYFLGGVGSAILEFMSQRGFAIRLKSFELKDEFVPHGNIKDVEDALGFESFKEIILKDIQGDCYDAKD